MANRTVKDAKSIRGTNPQFLIEKIIRSRIYECKFWKEECFALSAELIVDKAMELRYLGGVYGGNIKPSPFLCLILKMLQIQPEKDIIVEFIRNEEFKYVRALGAMYMRLVGTSIEVYKYLEPLLNDGRKLRQQNRDGTFAMIHVDEYIDGLLHEERMFDVILPRIQKRHVLEEANELESRISALDDDADDMDSSAEDDDDPPPRSVPNEKSHPRRDDKRSRNSPSPVQNSRNPKEKDDRGKERDRKHRERERDRGDVRDKGRERDRNEKHSERSRAREGRSRSRERRHARSSRSPERRRDRDRDRDRERQRSDRARDDRGSGRKDRDHDRRRDRDRERANNNYG